jgi:hypothetical protein
MDKPPEETMLTFSCRVLALVKVMNFKTSLKPKRETCSDRKAVWSTSTAVTREGAHAFMTVSSAYGCNFAGYIPFPKSLIKNENNTGAKMEPLGTHLLIKLIDTNFFRQISDKTITSAFVILAQILILIYFWKRKKKQKKSNSIA